MDELTPPARPAARGRVRALVPPLATVLAVALFVAAGNWQRERMHEKQALQAVYDKASRAAPAALPELPRTGAAAEWAALRYRFVRVRGTFDAARQILVDNRVRDARAGYAVVAPLRMDDGRIVLVERGWIPVGPRREAVPDVPVPQGEVEIAGRVAVPTLRYFELAPDARPNAVWQHLDPIRFAQVTGLDVLPIVIEQSAAVGPEKGALVQDLRAPDFRIETHRIYMVQWYAFAALAVALFVGLNARDWWQRRRRS